MIRWYVPRKNRCESNKSGQYPSTVLAEPMPESFLNQVRFPLPFRRWPVLLDGAWGTALQQRGLPIGESPEEWNLSHPDDVFAIARSYIDAGSEVILTNTFGVNRIALARHGLAHRLKELMLHGIELSRRAADDNAKVFASIGPTGLFPSIDESCRDDCASAFGEIAELLHTASVDAVVLETMSDATEASIALREIKRIGVPVVVSFVFDSGADGMHTMMGNSPEEIAEAFTAQHADALGLNCGRDLDAAIGVCRRLRAATSLPLWCKPNAGIPEWKNHEIVYPMGPPDFVLRYHDLIDAGANFIGGCCGTTPEVISALARSRDDAGRV